MARAGQQAGQARGRQAQGLVIACPRPANYLSCEPSTELAITCPSRRSTFLVGLPGQDLLLEVEGPAVPSSSGPATLWGVTMEAGRGLHEVAAVLGPDYQLSRQGGHMDK